MIKNKFFPLTITKHTIKEFLFLWKYLEKFGEEIRSTRSGNCVYSWFAHSFLGGVEFFFNELHTYEIFPKNVDVQKIMFTKYPYYLSCLTYSTVMHYSITVDCRNALFNGFEWRSRNAEYDIFQSSYDAINELLDNIND